MSTPVTASATHRPVSPQVAATGVAVRTSRPYAVAVEPRLQVERLSPVRPADITIPQPFAVA
jgi:hypothetical protein